MNALRFVLDGSGADTVVDGKPCPMAEGDLILTPGWTWHEHIHHGTAPIVWLDVLDASLHRYLGTDAFEPGPPHDVPARTADAAFAFANVLPEVSDPTLHSPVSVIRGRRLRRRFRPFRADATVPGACATSIRRPAVPRCRYSTAP